MSNNNGYVRAEVLVAEREKDVVVGDRKYRIQRLPYEQLVELRGAMVDVSQMAVDQKGKGATKEPDAKTIAAMRRLLVAGLLEPKLEADPKKGATPDDLPIEDFFVLAAAVMNLAGARRETGERVLP